MSEERSEALTGLRVALVGPGRVGASLAHWVRARGASVELVAGRTVETREEVAASVGARAVGVSELSSADCDLVLVAVADPALDRVARELSRRPQASVALHTAGARGASALAPLAEAGGTACGTFHPLKAFPAPLPDPAEAEGTFFALDGPGEAVAMGRRLARTLGADAEVVADEDRPLYHLAASVAAGGVTTLVASAAGLARDLGLPDGVGRGYATLAAGALDRLRAAAAETDRDAPRGARTAADAMVGAITGPVARGELESFARQMATLADAGEPGRRRLELFVALATETVHLCADRDPERPPGRGRDADAAEALRRALRAAGIPRVP